MVNANPCPASAGSGASVRIDDVGGRVVRAAFIASDPSSVREVGNRTSKVSKPVILRHSALASPPITRARISANKMTAPSIASIQ